MSGTRAPKRRGPNAQRTDATRRELVRAALDYMSTHGYDNSTIDEIARSAGMTKGAVYHHYRSKAELLDEVTNVIQRDLRLAVLKQIRSIQDPLQRLQVGCVTYLDLVATDPSRYRMLFLDGIVELGWARWSEIDRQHWQSDIRAAFVELLGNELAPPAASIVLGVLTHEALNLVTEPIPETHRDALAAIELVLDRLGTLAAE